MSHTFRLAVPDDSDKLLAIYSHYIADSSISFEITMPSPEQYRSRVANICSFYPYIVCEEAGDILGYAYASRFHEREGYDYCVSVSVYLRQGMFWSGLGTMLYERLFRLLPKQNFQIAYAGITQPNPASNRIHERFGFTKVGLYRNGGYKLGKWHDVLWMEKILGDFPVPPAPLVAIGQLDEELVADTLLFGCQRGKA